MPAERRKAWTHMSLAEREAFRADAARTKFSTSSLATGRRRKTKTPDQLQAEQAQYRNRFKATTPSPKKMAVISDVNGNYPDSLWTRPDH